MTAPMKKCYHDHPALSLGNGKVIYGGNGEFPAIEDADVYVSLDFFKDDARSYPWNPGLHFKFSMTDGQAPKNHDDFSALINWLSEQITSGKKVHVGCIGGHGRTGTLLSALVAMRMQTGLLSIPDDDPIAYVRKNYCEKAVETKAQVEYLVKNWGCKTAESSRTSYTNGSTKGSSTAHQYDFGGYTSTYKSAIYSSEKGSTRKTDGIDSGTPFRGKSTIWSKRVQSSVAASK